MKRVLLGLVAGLVLGIAIGALVTANSYEYFVFSQIPTQEQRNALMASGCEPRTMGQSTAYLACPRFRLGAR